MVSQDNLRAFVQNIQLVRLRGREVTDPSGLAGNEESALRRWVRRWLPFSLVVGLPTLVSAVYFFALAAPRYQSEAQFIVRMPGNGAASQIANLVQGTSVIRSVDDGYVVDAYIESRDALQQLVAHDGFRKIISRSGHDILWRYPQLFGSDTQDRLFEYYKNFVSISYDQTTGISTVRVQAFRPQDAQRLLTALLTHSEVLINNMNDRAQQDAIRVAEQETDLAKDRAYAAAREMTAFRNREQVIDPTLISNSVLDNITQLALDSAQANAELGELEKTSPQSPQISSLKIKVSAIDDQIVKEREQLAGPHGALAPRIAEYDILLLKRQFAERTFNSALGSLEAARIDARKQRVFLERITTPSVPDHPAYPYRILSILGIFVVMSMIYKIGRTFVSDTAEHATR